MQQKLQIQDYELIKELGKGAFATVFKAIKQSDQQIYAIKLLEKSKFIKNAQLKEYVLGEIKTIKQVEHENIVKCYEVLEDDNYLYIVMEYCEEDLTSFLQNSCQKGKQGLSENEVKNIFSQILQGMWAIHLKGYAHRDIKLQNVLVKNKSIFKIADFGFSKSLGQEQKSYTSLGTPDYMAPELHIGQGHNYKVDIWALGVLLYILIFCEFPFSANGSIAQLEKMKKLTLLEVFDCEKVVVTQYSKKKATLISNDMKDLIKQMLVFDPKERIDFHEIHAHPFLNTEGQIQQIRNKSQIFFQNKKYDNIDQKYQQVTQGLQQIQLQENQINQKKENQQQELDKKDQLQQQQNKVQLIIQNNTQQQNQAKGPLLQQQQQQQQQKQQDKSSEKQVFENKYLDNDQKKDLQQLNQIGISFQESNLFSILSINNWELSNIQFQEPEFVKQYKRINFEVQKYKFLENLRNTYFYQQFPQNEFSLKFALAKMQAFCTNQLFHTLQQGKNVFQLENFDQFLKSKTYSYLITDLEEDFQRACKQMFVTMPQAILEYQQLSEDQIQFFSNQLPEKFDSIKKIYRIIITQKFEQTYKHSQNLAYLKLCLKLMFAMVINRIFDISTLKENFLCFFSEIQQISDLFNFFDSFNLWLENNQNHSNLQELLSITIETYFPKSK